MLSVMDSLTSPIIFDKMGTKLANVDVSRPLCYNDKHSCDLERRVSGDEEGALENFAPAGAGGPCHC